jgi:hypothetical protein
LSQLEGFFSQFPNTINAAMALATFIASVIALWSARHAWAVSQPRIEVIVRASQLAAQDGKLFLVNIGTKQNCVSVLVRNLSSFPIAFSNDSLAILYPEGGGVHMYAIEPLFSEGNVQVAPFSETVRMWFELDDFKRKFGRNSLHRHWLIRRLWKLGFNTPGRIRARIRTDKALRRTLNAEISRAEHLAAMERKTQRSDQSTV